VLEAAKATPAPPVGPALGQRGVNLMEFCKKFNAVTADKAGLLIPVVVTVSMIGPLRLSPKLLLQASY